MPNSQISDQVINILNRAGIKKVLLTNRDLAKNKDILRLSDKFPNRIFPIIKTKGKSWSNDKKKFVKSIEGKKINIMDLERLYYFMQQKENMD